jgi:hypothetical protein
MSDSASCLDAPKWLLAVGRVLGQSVCFPMPECTFALANPDGRFSRNASFEDALTPPNDRERLLAVILVSSRGRPLLDRKTDIACERTFVQRDRPWPGDSLDPCISRGTARQPTAPQA